MADKVSLAQFQQNVAVKLEDGQLTKAEYDELKTQFGNFNTLFGDTQAKAANWLRANHPDLHMALVRGYQYYIQ
ncbi:MAG: hypothetical protein AAB426_00545 [Myxococcota bacterium]